MKRKEFLEQLEKHRGKVLMIEVDNGIIQKSTLEKFVYKIEEDRLFLQNNMNTDLVVLNLNTVRDIREDSENKNITLWLEDKSETKIKISVI